MNSLDDFARLRPQRNAATAEELDEIWAKLADTGSESDTELVGPGSTGQPYMTARGAPAPGSGRRRLALIGAAASLVVGVVAIAAVSDRAAAPPAVGDTAIAPTTAASPNATETTMAPAASETQVEADDPPRWGVSADGWQLAQFDDVTDGPDGMLRLFAGPDGLAQSWVVVVEGMSEPLVDNTATDGESALISSQSVATESGSALIVGGGVDDDTAMAVFRASQAQGSLPDGFVETETTADATTRTIRYRFVHDDGETISIDVQGAGVPRYRTELAAATAVEAWEASDGADEASVAYVGEYTLLIRHGFWVSRIITSASPDAATSSFGRQRRSVRMSWCSTGPSWVTRAQATVSRRTAFTSSPTAGATTPIWSSTPQADSS